MPAGEDRVAIIASSHSLVYFFRVDPFGEGQWPPRG
jgi:hypothetical protein